ncbi:aromatic acid exporter family protein [Bacillus sp. MUM 13]|uniref:FUSC family protein n=1 Tax=Bacillus sp. MUM 13 TaxID=1678001 RepID=UPI000A6E9E31|nr:aromatic acid exporter family protein [Bacillus sp. MUM 13]
MKTTKNQIQSENLSILIWKLAIGSTLSWEIAKLCGSIHPYLAPLSVIISLQSTMDKTIRLSIKRVSGTIIGIFVTVLIASHMTVNAWNLGLLILLGCFAAKYLNLDKKVIHQVALTILFVFVFEHQTKHYAIDRMRDTLIGVLVTGIIQLIWFRLILPNIQKKPNLE